MTGSFQGPLDHAIAQMRVKFDDPQRPEIVLDADDCRAIANGLVEFELAAEAMRRSIIDLDRSTGSLSDENRELRAANDLLVRENQMLRRQLAGETAEIVPFRQRPRPGIRPAAAPPPEGGAA